MHQDTAFCLSCFLTFRQPLLLSSERLSARCRCGGQ